MPTLTPTDLDDYRALTTACGLVDLTPLRSRVELTGDDRHAFLHNFCTNDIRGLADGAGCEAFLLDAKGHVLFYVFAWRTADRLLVELSVGRGAALVQHLDKYLIREKVKIRDVTDETRELLVAGPRAAALIQEVLGLEAPAKPQANVVTSDGVIVVRSEWTPEPNWVLVGSATAIAAISAKLNAAGARACEPAAFETLRIEAGLPLDGLDMSDKNLAQEIDRNERTLHFRKGCYLGQETVARLDALGHVNKRLLGVKFLTLDPATPPEAGAALSVGGQTVGTISSAAFSPRLGAWVALAYIRESSNAAGTKLDTPHGPAEVASLPLILV